MDQSTIIFATVLAAVFAAIGAAVGKAWGSYGKQTTILCELAQKACRGRIEAILESIVERLKRIEQHVLDNKPKHE